MPAPHNLRIDQPQGLGSLGDLDVDVEDVRIDPDKNAVVVELPDGSVTVNLGPVSRAADAGQSFGANLAEQIESSALAALADDLLRGIDQDEESRKEWLDERAEAIRMLALKVEKPGSSSEGGAPLEGMARVKHPMMLEASLRFQATAAGELLPASGPVKIRDDSNLPTADRDELADAIEKDLNHFYTVTATEYYPDTKRMLLMTGAGGSGFKKVYRCPLRRRPVSESVDAADLIVSNAATDMANADRVTHRIMMRPSVLKRMQVIGAYLDVPIGHATQENRNAVDQARDAVAGVSSTGMQPEDEPHMIYESYCLLDIPGFEHEEGGEATGLPRPYKVAIETTSRQILEIRRNWREDDEMEQRRRVFVKYSFVPAFGFYDVGLYHIMGNTTLAATALWRLGLDNGMFANFPGFLYANDMPGAQQTNIFRVAPGAGAPIKTGGQPIGNVVMPLPYKEMGPATMQLAESIIETGQRIGGTAELQVGEGRQDAPVGSTIAMLEAANRVMDAVHKGLCQAQAEEFGLVEDLFRENPEDFWRFNRKPTLQWNKEQFLQALDDNDLIPVADPNTSSHVQRVMRAQAVYMMAKDDPQAFDVVEVRKYVLRTIGVSNPQSMLSKAPPGAPPPDPKAQADLISAQADMLDAQNNQTKLQIEGNTHSTDDQNRDLDRENDLKIAQIGLQKEALVHSAKAQQSDADRAHDATKQQFTLAHAAMSDQAQQERDHDQQADQQKAQHAQELKLAKIAAKAKPKVSAKK